MKTLRLAVAVALAVTAVPASAVDFTIGTPTGGNCFPFGCQIAGQTSTRYQQVYDAGAFSGPVTISALTFTVASGSGALIEGPVSLSLSTTSAGVATINTSDFNANVGANSTVVFADVLPAISGGLLTLTFSTPFTYNPQAGNLLLDLSRARIGSDFFGTFFQATNGGSTLFSRAHNYGINTIGHGLVTTFSTTTPAVPEPASWAMLITGFGLIGAVARRRRRAIAA